MAARSFLLDAQVEEGKSKLNGEGFPNNIGEARKNFASWLESALRERLEAIGEFTKLQPILLGSWSRHELCPKSDIDLLFAGPEAQVKEFIAKAFAAGLKLRARTPENAEDWSIGVEPFDVLALDSAIALEADGLGKLETQKPRARKMRRQILSAIRVEREERHRRQDSISSYMEPNLKFGAGGLRDIEQALSVKSLFPEKFAEASSYPFQVLATIKEQWLYLRSLLHLMGSSDILSAHDQIEVARLLKFETPKELMKFVQSQLERASFYADWACAQALASKPKKPTPLQSIGEAIQRLKEKPDLLLQFQIRLEIDSLVKPLSPVERGRALHKAVFADGSDQYFLALYRTRLLEALIPDLKKLKGLVQHDHYHRFTADAHLMQSLREVQRAKHKSRELGALKSLSEDLNAQEWWILKLTALFHDLAKGRKGDHSSEGAKLVDKYFGEWEYSEQLTSEVRWLVENHLILSTAAFRQNPQSRSTWQRLFTRGVQGRRTVLLTLFTAIDIRATNPEAWTDWKAQLLSDLFKNLNSPQAQNLIEHLKFAKEPGAEEWLLGLDPELLQSLSPRILVQDLEAASKAALPTRVLVTRGKLWVRFHRQKDESGIFLGFVKRLYGLGLNIQMASVNTLPQVGVYDWFCLRTHKNPKQVKAWLALDKEPVIKKPNVQFQSIELMAQDQEEWIISFRGRDQRGLLLSAALGLVEENLSLRWARAHTWGQQIDDIFSVEPKGSVEELIARLKIKFVT